MTLIKNLWLYLSANGDIALSSSYMLLELVQFGNVWRSNIGTASVMMERLTMRTHITFISIQVNTYNTRENDDVMIMLLLATVLSIPCRTLSGNQ